MASSPPPAAAEPSSSTPASAPPPADLSDASSRPTSPDLPLTMTASLVLTNLPRDATAALAEANENLFPPTQKVVVRFKPVGSAPPLPQKRELSRVSAGQKFEAVVTYLRRVLKVGENEGLCLYVNSCFAPALDEVVGNLWRCFKDSNEQLNVSYSMTPAFG